MTKNIISNLATVFTTYKYILENSKKAGFDSEYTEFWIKRAEEDLANFDKFDWNDFTHSQLVEIGFKPWADGLMLANIGHLLLTKHGTKFRSILGNDVIYDGKNINTDVRGGMLAFGVISDPNIIDAYISPDLSGLLIDRPTTKIPLFEGFFNGSYLTYTGESIELHIGSRDTIIGDNIHFLYNHIVDKVIPSNITCGNYTKHRVRIVRTDNK